MSSTKIIFVKPVRNPNGTIKYGPFIEGIASPIFVRIDNGIRVNAYKTPGACWDGLEFGHSDYVGPDGHSLNLVLPSLETWCIDGPSSSGERPWKRTGRPEDGTLTVTPSIKTPKYHGFVTQGSFVDA